MKEKIRDTLRNISFVYDRLIKFLYEAEKKIISGEDIDYSRIGLAKNELANSVSYLKALKADEQESGDILDKELYSKELSVLKKKILLYNKVSKNFMEMLSDGVQFYNTVLRIQGSLYNQKGKNVSLNTLKTISMRA